MAVQPSILDTSGAMSASSTGPGVVNAGLAVILAVTEAQNLPTGASNMNNVSSTWECFIGTKGGAGLPIAGGAMYLYGFWKRTSNTDLTAVLGDSGVFNGYRYWRIQGADSYAASPIEALSTGSGTSDASAIFTVPGITTPGDDRLVLGGAFPRVDSSSEMYGSGVWVNSNLASLTTRPADNTAAGGGGGIGCFDGIKASAGATGSTVLDSTRAAFASAPFGYCCFAIKPNEDERIKVKSGGAFMIPSRAYHRDPTFHLWLGNKRTKIKKSGTFV